MKILVKNTAMFEGPTNVAIMFLEHLVRRIQMEANQKNKPIVLECNIEIQSMFSKEGGE